jgi:DNA-3-methyladenine glycosylase
MPPRATYRLVMTLPSAAAPGGALAASLTRADPAPRPRGLARAALPIDTAELAHFLIGKLLVHDVDAGRLSGRIVETEAYVVGDAAAHAFIGETARNRALFLERGHAYIYLSYGCWYCLNVTGEVPGVGAGVLLRALEPVEGVALMAAGDKVVPLRDLARGPGRLGRAMRIDLSLYATDLCADGPLRLSAADRPAGPIGTSVRIGISREAQRPLRFYERGNPCVSGPRALSL